MLMHLIYNEEEELNINELEFNDPEKHKNYYLLKPTEDLLLQINNTTLKLQNKSIETSLDEKFIKNISENFQKWFNKDFSYEKLFKMLDKKDNLNTENIEVFDENNNGINNMTLLDEENNVDVIFLFEGIFLYSKKIKCLWKLLQIKKEINLVNNNKSLFV